MYSRIFNPNDKVRCFFCSKIIIDEEPATEVSYQIVQMKNKEKYLNKCTTCKTYEFSCKKFLKRELTGNLKLKEKIPNKIINIKVFSISQLNID